MPYKRLWYRLELLDKLKELDADLTAKRPLRASASVSIAAGGSGEAVISVPQDEIWFIKSWTITNGTNVTVSAITIDDEDTGEVDTVTDTEAIYGDLLTALGAIRVSGSNAGTAAETLAIEVRGYRRVRL